MGNLFQAYVIGEVIRYSLNAVNIDYGPITKPFSLIGKVIDLVLPM